MAYRLISVGCISIENWEEILDPPKGLGIVRATGGRIARLSAVAIFTQMGYFCLVVQGDSPICWDCIRREARDRGKQGDPTPFLGSWLPSIRLLVYVFPAGCLYIPSPGVSPGDLARPTPKHLCSSPTLLSLHPPATSARHTSSSYPCFSPRHSRTGKEIQHKKTRGTN